MKKALAVLAVAIAVGGCVTVVPVPVRTVPPPTSTPDSARRKDPPRVVVISDPQDSTHIRREGWRVHPTDTVVEVAGTTGKPDHRPPWAARPHEGGPTEPPPGLTKHDSLPPGQVRKEGKPDKSEHGPPDKDGRPGVERVVLAHPEAPGHEKKPDQGVRGEPGNKGVEHGNSGAEHGNKSAEHGGNGAEPGSNGAERGNKSAEHGSNGAEHGNNGAEHGGNGAASGNKGVDASNRGVAPGDKGAGPGTKGADHGNKGAEAGNTSTEHGQRSADAGKKSVEPGNKPVEPDPKGAKADKKAEAPGNQTAAPGKKSVEPGNKPVEADPKNAKTEKKAVASGGQTAVPGERIVEPDTKPVEPDPRGAVPAERIVPPGNRGAESGSQAVKPDNRTEPDQARQGGGKPAPAAHGGKEQPARAPTTAVAVTTIAQLLGSDALVGQRVQVTGTCLAAKNQSAAGGAPAGREDWQLGSGGAAIWVTGNRPEGCSPAANGRGEVTITAKVAEDQLPGRGKKSGETRRYLVIG